MRYRTIPVQGDEVTAPTLCICQRNGGTCTHPHPVPAMRPAPPLEAVDDTIGYCRCGHLSTAHIHGERRTACDPRTCGCRTYRPKGTN